MNPDLSFVPRKGDDHIDVLVEDEFVLDIVDKGQFVTINNVSLSYDDMSAILRKMEELQKSRPQV